MLPITGEARAGGAGTLAAATPVNAMDGGTWETVTTGVAADGLTLTVTGTDTLNGAMYRAIASNTHGEAVSKAATLTVTTAPGTNADGPAEGSNDAGGSAWSQLSVTGQGPTPGMWWAASVLLLVGAGLTAWGIRSRVRKE